MKYFLINVLCVLFILFVSHSSTSQIRTDFHVGISNSGIVSNHIEGELRDFWSLRLGLNHTLAKLSKKLSFQVGFSYYQQGYNQIWFNEKYKWRFRYLAVEPSIAYQFTPKIAVILGFSPAYRLSGRQRIGEESYRLPEDFRILDLGVHSRWEVSAKEKLTLFLAYRHSLRPILCYNFVEPDGQLSEKPIKDIFFRHLSFGIAVRLDPRNTENLDQ